MSTSHHDPRRARADHPAGYGHEDPASAAHRPVAPADNAPVGLPMAPLGRPMSHLAVEKRVASTYYALTAVDDRGRLADRYPLLVMGWQPRQRLLVGTIAGTLLVESRDDGVDAVTKQGHLRVRAEARAALGLGRGDRLLVAAFPDRGILRAFPLTVLDAMVLRHDELTPDWPRP